MITFTDVRVTYPGVTALDHVSFDVPPGRITALVGPNGAGKTTALRVLLGLARPDSGQALIAGQRYAELGAPAGVVGSLLDAEAFHPGRTGRECLRLACWTLGLPTNRADEMLTQVGLGPAGRRRVATYSLGMRQRLGVAHALIGDPAALVLDEPANGLDPQGQHWLGELLASQARRGCAVLLSSHALAEVERIADHLVVLAGGRVRADDEMAAVRRDHRSVEELFFSLTTGDQITTHARQ